MIVHTPSLMLVNIAVTATLGLSLGVVASRARRDGLALWAWAMGAHTLAYILFSLRGQISDVVSVVVATGLLSATIALFTEGLREFQQRRPAYGLSWFPVVLLMVGISVLMQAPQARVALSNLILLLQGLAALVLLIQKRHDTIGRGQYFEMVGFAILALVFVLRMVGALATTTDLSSITASNQIQTVTFLLATVALVLVGIGLVIMTKERADAQNLNMALHDALTGLSNRRLIVETLTQNLAQAQRSDRALTLLMIDIDFFKRVNDTFGHQSGDLALRGLADCIRGRLRAQDMAGRWAARSSSLSCRTPTPRGLARWRSSCVVPWSRPVLKRPMEEPCSSPSASACIRCRPWLPNRSTTWSPLPTRRCIRPSRMAATVSSRSEF